MTTSPENRDKATALLLVMTGQATLEEACLQFGLDANEMHALYARLSRVAPELFGELGDITLVGPFDEEPDFLAPVPALRNDYLRGVPEWRKQMINAPYESEVPRFPDDVDIFGTKSPLPVSSLAGKKRIYWPRLPKHSYETEAPPIKDWPGLTARSPLLPPIKPVPAT